MSPRRPWKRGDRTFGPKTIFDCPLPKRARLLMMVLADLDAHTSAELLSAMGIRDPGVGAVNRFNPVNSVLRDLRERWGCGFDTRQLGMVWYVRWDGKWKPEEVTAPESGPPLPLFELD